MSGQGSGYSGSLGYPGQQRAQQHSSQYTASTSSSSSDHQYDGRVRYAELSSLVPSATPAERQAAVGHYASQAYPPPHHYGWDTPPHRHTRYGTLPPTPTSVNDPGTGLPVYVPNNPTSPARVRMESHYYNSRPPAPAPLLPPQTIRTGHELLRSPSDAKQHFAAVPAQAHGRTQRGAPTNAGNAPTMPPGPSTLAGQAHQANPPCPQAQTHIGGDAEYDPPTKCNYCNSQERFRLSQYKYHLDKCPMYPYRGSQHTSSRVAAPPVTVVTQHQWRPGA